MKYYPAEQIGKTIIISLVRGDLLRESIAEIARKENIANGVVLSGIATFDIANFQMTTTSEYPIGYHVVNLNEPLELVSLDGTIINYEPHIHGVISNKDQTWAGHILDGCRILYLAELVIQEIKTTDLIRRPDENGVFLITEM
jgi:predicted DNA-binding protein with PD1-like motif